MFRGSLHQTEVGIVKWQRKLEESVGRAPGVPACIYSAVGLGFAIADGRMLPSPRRHGLKLEEAGYAFFQDYHAILDSGGAGFLIEQL